MQNRGFPLNSCGNDTIGVTLLMLSSRGTEGSLVSRLARSVAGDSSPDGSERHVYMILKIAIPAKAGIHYVEPWIPA